MVGAAEDVGGSVRLRFRIAQLTAPWNARASVRSRSEVFELHKTRRLFIRWIAPVVPALRLDVVAQLAFDVGNLSIRTPGASEIGLRLAVQFFGAVPWRGITGEPAAQEHKPEGMPLRSVGSSDVTAVLAVDFAMFEHGGGGTVDEVDPALDITLLR